MYYSKIILCRQVRRQCLFSQWWAFLPLWMIEVLVPLALSSGAGANSRISIGTGIVGGTLTATLLAIFFVPLFFVLIRRLFPKRPIED